MTALLPALVLLPVVAAAAAAVAGRLVAGRPERATRTRVAAPALTGLLVTVVLAVAAALAGPSATLAVGPTLELHLAVVPVTRLVLVLVPVVALAIVAWAAAHEPLRSLGRQVATLTAFVGAMELLVLAADLLTLLVAWEVVGALSWLLIGHVWRDADNPRAATQAFVATRAGDLGLFLATMAALAGTGSVAYAELAGAGQATLEVVAGGVLLAAAAKSAQVPFAPWLFAAMAGPTPASALLHSATMVAAGAIVLARLEPLLAPTGWFGPATLTIGLLTALSGGVVALRQHRAKRLLAASTSAQYGLMFVAIGAGAPGIAVLHLIAHALAKSLLFLTAGTAIGAVDSPDLARMRLGSHLRVTAVAAALGGLALAAVPPLGAAWTKEEVVAAAGHAHPVLAAAVVVAGGLSALYAGRYVLLAYGPSGGGPARPLAHRPGHVEQAAMVGLAGASVLLGLVWLPPVAHALEAATGARPTAGTPGGIAASLAAVAIALYAVRVLDRRDRLAALGLRDGPAAGWFGLARLADMAVVSPVHRLAGSLARFDARAERSVTTAATALARGSRALGAGDTRVVDAGVRGVAGLGAWLARVSTRVGERGADGLVEGIGLGVRVLARDARRLQSGQAHHYLTLVTIGTVAAAVAAAAWR